jgi:hypothetical protein
MKKETRTDTTLIHIKLAFLGASWNLCLLEAKLMEAENIPLYQYSNYLSQLAFCIELGLKGMIINTDDFDCIHDIEKLFSMSPAAFQTKFKSQYPDDVFKSNISNMKNIFEDFRYMKSESTLNEYLDSSVINNDRSINLRKVTGLISFQILRELLEAIFEYEEFIRNESLKQMQNTDCKDIDYYIRRHTDFLKNNKPILKQCSK